MRGFRFLCWFIVLAVVALRVAPAAVQAQFSSPEGVTVPNTNWIEVVADPAFRPVRIAPPEGLLELQGAAATFTVNYLAAGLYYGTRCASWPEQAKLAFDYAARIWGSLLSSPVPIVVDACWATNLEPWVLGFGGTNDLQANFRNAPQINTWYPVALANALYGSDLSPNRSDIYVALNSGIPWYFGIDGNTPQQNYDFATVVLHELAHGLGFLGTMWYGPDCGGENHGCWGYYGYPDSYDRFIQNGGRIPLLNTAVFPNPSALLGTELTSNNLYFNGSSARAANSGNPVKIYAPRIWQPGSSYAHLDYETFKDTPHRLMVYAISAGASVHHPGSVTLGILRDLGWGLVSLDLPLKVYLPLITSRR
ncbi:MAG: hypothetical protein RML93_00905 [Anaerolineales bacterium]|nr:hypothetical protein [Anaerolineales bacterium]MDW8445830.1 hypothetical protein [Anaerolineales bacterium]